MPDHWMTNIMRLLHSASHTSQNFCQGSQSSSRFEVEGLSSDNWNRSCALDDLSPLICHSLQALKKSSWPNLPLLFCWEIRYFVFYGLIQSFTWTSSMPPCHLSAQIAPAMAQAHLHSEVEHKAVRMGLGQLVEEVPPSCVRDHLLQPRGSLRASGKEHFLFLFFSFLVVNIRNAFGPESGGKPHLSLHCENRISFLRVKVLY